MVGADSIAERRSPVDQLDEFESLTSELLTIRDDVVAAAVEQQSLDGLDETQRRSAENLLHYLALRRRDLRPLQLRLAALGLSSLGRAESHVLSSVDAVLQALHRLGGRSWEPPAGSTTLAFGEGDQLLVEHADHLLGSGPHGRATRIMVTMPSEAADDYTLVHDLLEQGMNCMRVNCAHDDANRWLRMVENLRRAEKALGISCRLLMDLGGPKLRTGPVEPGPAVIKVKPIRDAFGMVVAEARLWLTTQDAGTAPPSAADATLPVPQDFLTALRVGDELGFKDARGADRSFRIVDVTPYGCWAESAKTAYIVAGTRLTREKANGREKVEAPVSELPPEEASIHLREGDTLHVTRSTAPGRPATLDRHGHVLTPGSIGCTLDAIFDDVQAGEPIWFDDGKIGGVIESTAAEGFRVRLTRVPPTGASLRGDKGINLPESHLRLSALTAKDVEDLEFVAQHADLVGLSFANSADDVRLLQEQLARLGAPKPAIVLKIETQRGFEHLPEMLLTAMTLPRCGVMIARGDLAVECGFERLAEVQEEILWICEAAHMPVIWATQVLENLAKQGLPSRAEITDAAMSHRAECVMLNKGPHVKAAVKVLDNILRRMEAHQLKKRSMLRELRLAHSVVPDERL